VVKRVERRGEVRCGEVKGGRRKEKRKLILKRKYMTDASNKLLL
jgi:hypothetical protein